MTNVDTFGTYVRHRLERWGDEFSLARDCEYLGHARQNMLQRLIDHKGEMPPPNVGFKPIEVDEEAMQVEIIIGDMAREQRALACVMRGFYCGSGRRKVERWETANLLIAYTGGKPVSVRQYLSMHEVGFAHVRGVLTGIAIAA